MAARSTAAPIDLTGGATLVGTDSGGTLSGVTLDGTLDMTGYYPFVNVTGGLTLNGTIDLGATNGDYYADLHFLGAQTLAGTGSIVFGNWGIVFSGSAGNQITTARPTAIREPSRSARASPSTATAARLAYNSGGTQTPLVIQGTIDADARRHDRGLRHQLDQCRHARGPVTAAALPQRHLDRCRRDLRAFRLDRLPAVEPFTLGSGTRSPVAATSISRAP